MISMITTTQFRKRSPPKDFQLEADSYIVNKKNLTKCFEDHNRGSREYLCLSKKQEEIERP